MALRRTGPLPNIFRAIFQKARLMNLGIVTISCEKFEGLGFTMFECCSSRCSRSSNSHQKQRPTCIGYDEQIRFEAKVKVRSRRFNRSRDLFLTDAPRLIVISSWSGSLKREIFLTPDTTVNEIDPHTFDVVSASNTIRITDSSNLAQKWARAISEVISE
ncbi:hypothetical protein KXD40_002379 [Peronospora effusa]|uniref:PDK1-type PH domain-containing protein n=1 Tax=Peronospora effusa TaxID=542832 RepID=A0A3M6VFQ0_9STRA|nr:hypothetical protein DD238_002784 [Peronospora effusa]UIZ26633.1 hypothetical protein KXD40_002379 [Peronospora effusa]